MTAVRELRLAAEGVVSTGIGCQRNGNPFRASEIAESNALSPVQQKRPAEVTGLMLGFCGKPAHRPIVSPSKILR